MIEQEERGRAPAQEPAPEDEKKIGPEGSSGTRQALDALGFEVGEIVQLAAIRGRGEIAARSFEVLSGPAAPAEAETWARSLNAAGFNVYVCTNPLRERLDRKARAENLARVRILELDVDPEKTTTDLDGTMPIKRAACEAAARQVVALLETTTGARPALVSSGRGWQVWIRHGELTQTERVALHRGLAKKFESGGVHFDGTHDPPRLARLPGFTNHKTSEVARLVDPGNGVSLVREALLALNLPRVEEADDRPVEWDVEPPSEADRSLLEACPKAKYEWENPVPKGERSHRCFRFVIALVKAGASEATACRLYWTMPRSKGREDGLGQNYWEYTIGSVRRHLADEQRKRLLAQSLPETAKKDPGAPFEREALEALALVMLESPPEWHRIRAALKKAKVPVARLERAVRDASAADGPSIRYRAAPDGIWNGEERLTNFVARIEVDTTEDDGSGETRKVFEIVATLDGRTTRLEVPAEKFRGMRWPIEKLGASAILEPGREVAESTAVAIQYLSRNVVEERRVFTHTGWRELESGRWAYLHAGGAITAEGNDESVHVKLQTELAGYRLPEPAEGRDLVEAIRASLRLLRVAPPGVAWPIYAGIWRAVLGPCDFTLWFQGPSGALKTSFAALAQAHFGDFDARRLPGSWSSTANALETKAYLAKDALFVADDFVFRGSPVDVQRISAVAARLVRSQGNKAGRSRLDSNMRLRAERFPRGLTLVTGEDGIDGQSERARIFLVEVSKGEIDLGLLTVSQADAVAGLYPRAMAAFLRWLAPTIAERRKRHEAEVAALRATIGGGEDAHLRTPTIVADLALGAREFLSFACESGAIDEGERAQLEAQMWKTLLERASAQAKHQAQAEPARRFLDLLASAFATKRAHLLGADGGPVADPGRWGWSVQVFEGRVTATEPKGELVGWLEGEDVLLEPKVALAAAQRLARDTGQGFAVSDRALKRRLFEGGFLASRDEGREVYTVRRRVGGATREVLRLRADALEACRVGDPEPDAMSGKPDIECRVNPTSCRVEAAHPTAATP